MSSENILLCPNGTISLQIRTRRPSEMRVEIDWVETTFEPQQTKVAHAKLDEPLLRFRNVVKKNSSNYTIAFSNPQKRVCVVSVCDAENNPPICVLPVILQEDGPRSVDCVLETN